MASAFRGKASSNTGASGEDFPVAPAGTHTAVIVGLIDLGTHAVPEFNDPTKTRDRHKCCLLFELVETQEGHVLAVEYTVSTNSKAKLRILAEMVRGRAYQDHEDTAFDTDLLGKPVQVVVEQGESNKGKAFAKIADVSGLHPKLIQAGVQEPSHKDFLDGGWSVGDDIGPIDRAKWLPWLYGKTIPDTIRACQEMRGAAPAASTAGAAAPAQRSAARLAPSAASSPAANGQAPAPPPRRPAPTQPAPSQNGPMFWVDKDDGKPAVQQSFNEIETWLIRSQKSATTVYVMPVGSPDGTPWRTAAEAGMSDQIPF